jgi:hypothetical protein
MTKTIQIEINLRRPHPKQAAFIRSPAPRKIVRAGRRSGKTSGVAIMALKDFLDSRRVLYAVPTEEQVERFWFEIKRALQPAIEAGYFYKNETKHIIEVRGTENRIRAKTAWNADTLRGDYADRLILDEWQLMNERAWGEVGAPMLLDNNGDAVFVYTPPSITSASYSKAKDKQHAAKMFQKAQLDTSGRWAAFHFTSLDNPHISLEALDGITEDMTHRAYRQEILAEDLLDNPGALWQRSEMLDPYRVTRPPIFERIVVGVDPASGPGTTGIVVAGSIRIGKYIHAYVLEDLSLEGSPAKWATQVVSAFNKWGANEVIAEANQGGEMVRHTINSVEGGEDVKVTLVHASLGKQARAEPIAARYEKGRVHHIGLFDGLEDEYCWWVPGTGESPNRLDAAVWALTKLLLVKRRRDPVWGKRPGKVGRERAV